MKIEGGEVTLSSGRVLYANQGLLSLSEDGVLHEGYDGRIHFGDDPDPDEPGPLTSEERREIAEFMIARWAAWAGLDDTRKETT